MSGVKELIVIEEYIDKKEMVKKEMGGDVEN